MAREFLVIVGTGSEVPALALRSADTHEVLTVGRLHRDVAAALTDAGVRVAAAVTASRLEHVLGRADVVVVAGANDPESNRLAKAVVAASGTLPFPSTILVDDAALAAAWRAEGHHATSRTEALATAALRAVPPSPPDLAAPPPIVVGDTALAVELARRIVVGWPRAGDPFDVHCVARDGANHLATATGGLASTLSIDEALDLDAVAAAIDDRIVAWSAPPVGHGTVTGPTLYIVASDDDAPELATTLAARFPTARTCLVWPGEARDATPGVVTITPATHLADLGVLLMTPEVALAEEICTEVAGWPLDIATLFGPIDPPADRAHPLASLPKATRAAIEGLARHVAGLLVELGLMVDSESGPARVILSPAELRLLRDRLVELVPAPEGVPDAEHAQRALELAARLPTLLARTGRHPRRPDGYTDPFADVADLAVGVHSAYQRALQRLGLARATADLRFDELGPFEQESNRAQLADVPAKLAAVGLTVRVSHSPDTFVLSAEVVDRLAELEHRRWFQFERRNGRCDHTVAVPWDQLDEPFKELNRQVIRALPGILVGGGLEIVDPSAVAQDDPPNRSSASADASGNGA